MKTIKYIFVSLFVAAILWGCAKHDFFDEHLNVGRVGPQAFWEPAGSVVRAGGYMPFMVDYYHTVAGAEVRYLEVWHDLTRIEERDLFSPWVTQFALRSVIETRVRIPQMAARFYHDKDMWNDSVRAFRLHAAFPVDRTLFPIDWVHPGEFNEQSDSLLELHFGDTNRFGGPVMEWFRDSLYRLMVFDDWRRLFVDGLTEFTGDEFKELFTDSTFARNPGRYIYRFPANQVDTITGELIGRTIPPFELDSMFNALPFQRLIQRRDGNYEVTFRQTFRINARMRIYDNHGVFGLTEERLIDIN